MGETASAAHTRLIVTGTLTLRYERPLPFGKVTMRAQITREDDRKVTVTAHLGSEAYDDNPAVEATGLFIVPRWAGEGSVSGSLD